MVFAVVFCFCSLARVSLMSILSFNPFLLCLAPLTEAVLRGRAPFPAD
jgi:hypothetical protein